MRKYCSVLIAIALIAGCGSGEVSSQILPSSNSLEELSSTTLTSSRLTTYRTGEPVAADRISNHPINNLSEEGWEVRRWAREIDGQEQKDLLTFLREEKKKYSRSGKYQEQVKALDRIIEDLSGGLSNRSRIAYFYKSKPGDEDYLQGDWLYLYYMDLEDQTVTKITNAFR